MRLVPLALLVVMAAGTALAGDEPQTPLQRKPLTEWIAQLASPEASQAAEARTVLVALFSDPASELVNHADPAPLFRHAELARPFEALLAELSSHRPTREQRALEVLAGIAERHGYLGQTGVDFDALLDRDLHDWLSELGEPAIEPLVALLAWDPTETEAGLASRAADALFWMRGAASLLLRTVRDEWPTQAKAPPDADPESVRRSARARWRGRCWAAFAFAHNPDARLSFGEHPPVPNGVDDLVSLVTATPPPLERESRPAGAAPATLSDAIGPQHRALGFVYGSAEAGVERALVERALGSERRPQARLQLLLALRFRDDELRFSSGLLGSIAASEAEHPRVRAEARFLLEHRNGEIPALIEWLASDDEWVSRRATWLLTKRDFRAVAPLEQALADGRAVLRRNAAWALARLHGVAGFALPALVARLGDPDTGVREATAFACGWIAEACEFVPDGMVPGLRRLLKDPNAKVQGAAAGALGRLGPVAAPAAEDILRLADATPTKEVRTEAILALCLLAPDTVKGAHLPVLVSEVLEMQAHRREAARNAMAQLRGKALAALLPLVEAELEDGTAFSYGDMLHALGDIGPAAQAFVPALEEFVGADPRVHRGSGASVDVAYAREALWSVRPDGVQQAVGAAEKALADSSYDLPDPFEVLDDLGPRAAAAVPVLVRALSKGRDAYTAAEALGKIGKPLEVILPALREALAAADPDLRWAALRGLGRLGPCAAPAFDQVLKALSDRDLDVREEAVRTLGRLELEPARTVTALLRALDDADGPLRARAAAALSRFPSESARSLPALERRLTETVGDEDTRVQEEVVFAVLKLRGGPPPPK